jgi:hypothetical protein
MSLLEELLKSKEDLLVKFVEILEGKEARARVNLDGVRFNIGKSIIKMNGTVEFIFVPVEEKGKR